MTSCIVRPIITEKSLSLASRGWYTFQTDTRANKRQIAQDVATLYHVHIVDIRTIAMHGKERHAGKRRQTLRQSDWKKAIVRLKTGEKIDAFEVSQETPLQAGK